LALKLLLHFAEEQSDLSELDCRLWKMWIYLD